MTTTEGIEAVFLETRNWGRAAGDGRVWTLQAPASTPPSAATS